MFRNALDFGTLQKPYLASITPRVPGRATPWVSRSHATAGAACQRTAEREEDEADAISPSDGRYGRPEWRQDPVKQSSGKHTAVPPPVDEGRPSGLSRVPRSDQAALEKELRYLRDPMKLADYTVSLLRKDEDEKAYELVKMSSKNMACTVSWNHLMDYEMAKGRVANAMKIYNDMKKRAQRVDTHTFTILLRGLAWHTDYPTALQRAISLYHSLYAENSPVKPTIIHTNAVLKVCARAKDLDALWGVAARLPKHGRCAPDNATFTTILNAVHRITRETAWEPGLGESDLSPQERADQIQRAVLQGRRMWAEIVERWRNGDIMLDEGLVCSMGRLLLLSDVPQDLDDILSLAEQTMGIRRQATCLPPKAILTNPAGKYLSVPPQQSSPTSEDESTDIVSASDQTAGPFASAGDDFVPGQEFDPITPKTFNIAGYVVPGPNTLSLLVDACTRLHSIRAAQDYWGLLTSEPYNISPDTDNYHTYLRLLRVQRASRLCVELVQEMRDGLGVGPPVEHSERRGVKGEEGGVRGKTFRIAMSACVRDSNNPNVLQHASKLCRMMTDCLPTPDMKAFSMFLDIALKTAAVNNDWRLLSTVLRGTELGIRGLRNHLHWDTWAKTKRANEYKEILEGDLRDFLRKLIGAYDYLINGSGHEMMHDELKKCKDQRSIISGWETKLGRIEGNLRGQKLLWEEGKERGHGRGMIEIRGNYGERRQLLGRKDTRNGREGETGRYLDKKMRGEEDEEDKGEGYDWKRESDSWGPAKANGADNSERASQSPKWGRPSTTEHRKYRPRDNSSGEGGQWKRINWSEVGEDKC